MSTNDHTVCPECGQPVREDGPHRVCPACLMAQAMASRTVTGGRGERPAAQTPPSPEEIADKFPQFEITECLGRGGMGVVYKARQKSLDRWVAIKILAPAGEREKDFAARFAREAQTLARMNHPNIVTVFDHGETDGLFYFVMEFVDGVNLRDLLRKGRMEPEQALAIVPPICEALQYAHDKGVIHRDIKPENLLLDREGRVMIADFGVAKLMRGAEDSLMPGGEPSTGDPGLTIGGTLGTPQYMAPEQEQHSRAVDHRSDIYALGVVFYEMLTGERPAKDLVAPSRKVELDVRIDEIVLRALEKEPAKRYQTVGEFRTMVQTVVSTPAPPDSPVPPSPAGNPPAPSVESKSEEKENPKPEKQYEMNITGKVTPDKLALGFCLAGIIGAAIVAMLGRILNEDLSMIAYGSFVALEIAALVLGIICFAQPLGKAAVITSGILLIGSLAFIS